MRLFAFGVVLFACLIGTDAGAASSSFTFDGSNVASCSLSSNTYTCNTFPLSGSTDTMTIADGYTVNVKGSVAFGYNQGLAMSGSATLNVSGDLDIGSINPANLLLTGGNLVSNGAFTVGSQAQTIKANISAVSMTLGSGSTTSITGSVSATGAVSIGSHCTISGPVSGSTITTNSPATINGNVTATTAFTLASGSTVSGNIVAPTVTLQASNSTVTGSITAKTSLELGSSDTVNGDVSAGNLVLDSSNAIVNGNATVTSATLNWGGRVTNTLYCTGGTTNGGCDCVTNNSGYAVNTTNGPHCAAPPSPLDHFLIVHDGIASACTPETVTVKACANAACSSYYTGGVNVTLQPGGGSFAIGSSGVNASATVSQSSVGNATLGVSASSVAAANPLQCNNTSNSSGAGSGSPYCTLNFNNSIGLSLAMQDQNSGSSTTFSLSAMILDQNSKSCKPAFPGQAMPVQFSCGYSNPASGTLPVLARLHTSAGNTAFSALNASNASTGQCDSRGAAINVGFPANGSAATLDMNYADVGQMNLKASLSYNGSTISANANVIVAPAAFQITSTPASTIAALPFKVVATAVNASGNPTPNFGLETAVQGVSPETVNFSLGALGTQAQGCGLTASMLGVLGTSGKTATGSGAITGSLTYTEAGAFNIQVQQASSNYLGGAVARPAAVQTVAASGCGAVGSIPAYFQVNEGRVGTGKANFYYSGEPVDVTVTARNALGNATLLYDNRYGYSNPVLFSANDVNGAALAATLGGLSGTGSRASTPLPASAFANGAATLSASAAAPLVFSFVPTPYAPTRVRLRAAEAAGNGVGSANGPTYSQTSEDIYEARSGRLRIGGNFGSASGILILPISAEYWTGASWLRNVSDTLYNGVSLHPIPVGALALQANAPLLKPGIGTASASPPNCLVSGILTLQQGQCSLLLQPAGGIGMATVAINLGSTNSDASCLPSRPTSSGAAMPYLRGANGICIGSNIPGADPAARATFGVYPPETKRLIHVREVFN